MNAPGRKGNIMDKFLWKPFLAEEGAGAGAGGDDTKTEPQEPLTFDKMLEMDGMQAEFDRRLSKGIDTAVKNAVEKERTRLEALHNDQLTEVEKLAQMNEAEKNKYLAEKREAEYLQREADLTRRELAAQAKDELADRGLPIKLAEVLNYSSAEACKESMDAIEAAFNAEVEAKVAERLKGGKPPKDAETEGDRNAEEKLLAESIAKAMGVRQ